MIGHQNPAQDEPKDEADDPETRVGDVRETLFCRDDHVTLPPSSQTGTLVKDFLSKQDPETAIVGIETRRSLNAHPRRVLYNVSIQELYEQYLSTEPWVSQTTFRSVWKGRWCKSLGMKTTTAQAG